MNMLSAGRKILLPLLLLLLTVSRAHAQSPPKTAPPDELSRTIASLDSALFDAYNQCDLEKFGAFFIDDVEFYHDQDGVILGRQRLTESVKNNTWSVAGTSSRRTLPQMLFFTDSVSLCLPRITPS